MQGEAHGRPTVGFRLLGVTDRKLLVNTELDDWLAILCWYGLRGVMIREKDLEEEALYQLAEKCRPIFDRHHLPWFVNGSVPVAKRAEATGVHLTAAQDVAAARATLGAETLLGQSVHSLQGAIDAERAGADLLVFGPIYATPGKARYGPPQGHDRLRAVCEAVRIPVFAIGGVVPERAQECRRAGAHGVAALSSLMQTNEPEETLAKYEHYLEHL